MFKKIHKKKKISKSIFISLKYPSLRYKFLLLCILWFGTRATSNCIALFSKTLSGNYYLNIIISFIFESFAYCISGFLINMKLLGRRNPLVAVFNNYYLIFNFRFSKYIKNNRIKFKFYLQIFHFGDWIGILYLYSRSISHPCSMSKFWNKCNIWKYWLCCFTVNIWIFTKLGFLIKFCYFNNCAFYIINIFTGNRRKTYEWIYWRIMW